MNIKRNILLAFILFFFLGFKTQNSNILINGILLKNPTDTSAYINGLQILVKADSSLITKAITDDNGKFSISVPLTTKVKYDFYCSGLGIGTLFLGSKEILDTQKDFKITLYIPNNYEKNKLGKIICKKCKQADKVYNIVHSISPVYTRRISNSGDTIYSPIYKNTYQEDCTGGLAKYYCDRDKIKF